MIEIQLKLPDWAIEYIDQQIATGKSRSADELVAELIDEARVIVADDHLAELIREGMESGEGVEINDAWWERRTAELRSEAERRRTA
jgi:Arc/MetJ-type ribon-helix-helix transcriptional regulator